MKKSIVLLTAIFSFAVLFLACKEVKKEEVKTETIDEHDGHDHATDAIVASKDVYQCPMDCEKGKTYDVAGKCPTCEMDLKVVNSVHTADCICIKDGDCKCAPDECKCKSETAACTKCAPGECTCEKEVAKLEKECSHCMSGKCECKA